MKAKKSKGVGRVLWGLYFLGAAVVLLLQGFGVITLGEINLWIMVVLAGMLAVVIAFITQFFWIGATMVATWGMTIAGQAGLIGPFTGGQVGTMFIAAALVGIGLHVIFSKCKGKFLSIEMGDEEDDDVVAKFAGKTRYFKDEAFEEANLVSTFGDVKAYFEDVKLKGEKATIRLDVSFGAVELYVPKNWELENKVNVGFGDVQEKNQPKLDAKSPRVELVGNVKFGGVTVTYI